MKVDPSIVKAFTPTGHLRASINFGNPILAHKASGAAQASGISVDLAQAFADHLGVPLSLVLFDTAGQSVDAVSQDEADIGFFAIDPLRGEHILFTAPYVLIEGFYMVREASPIRNNADVDQPGHRVTVGKGSAYDLFLSRHLQHAEITRAATSQTVTSTFLDNNFEVAAGVRQQLEADRLHTPGLRLLDERFMVIRQAMGSPKSRGAAAAACLSKFLEKMKASGFIEAALARHGIAGASVAPPA